MVAPDPAPGQSDAAPAAGGRGLVSRILPPAIRLWLHSQLDHLENLDFRIEGRDRQILSGYLPQVSLSASQAVYQGLQVSRAEVRAEEIYLNLGQVIRGKALRLLQPFPVRGLVYLTREDLRASLQPWPTITGATGWGCWPGMVPWAGRVGNCGALPIPIRFGWSNWRPTIAPASS